MRNPRPRTTRKTPTRPGRGSEIAKRVIDIAGGVAAAVVLGPVLLGCMAWIAMIDGRPLFYSQWRVGRHGVLFRIWKLRTMTRDAERHGVAMATDGDPRVLPAARWVRRCHADELPQILNILLGQMSLVGPRPERPEVFELFRHTLPRLDRRLAATPGLTGLAQVSQGYCNDLAGMRRKLALDLRYLRRRSVLHDCRLILATVPKLWDAAAL